MRDFYVRLAERIAPKRGAGFIPQERAREAHAGKFGRQAAQGRSCGLTSAPRSGMGRA